ncbi:DUF177 domain-containing protein [Microbaculum marinum]|uniref:DUF177 domain-containing protein n=1 Tax=Microbaculum marinum TaxID=1764581 RepID=A0AAW9S1J9_9HYPH
MTAHPLSRIVRRDNVPADGLELVIEADPQERETLARLFDIPAVQSLEGTFHVAPWRSRGLKVQGHVEARVEQTCVVTLDPVENTVSEDVEVYFAAEGAAARAPQADAAVEAERDIEELVGDQIDIGALAAEHVALGLDPYPRKPGVEFAPGEFDDGEEEEKGPFAALSALKGAREGE